MKSVIYNFILFIFLVSISFGQTKYFISSSSGNDSNNGKSETQPIKTISKVNSLKLSPGDQVFFKKNDIWIGESLVITNSGSSNNPIVFSSYGDGNKPIITGRTALEGWSVEDNWEKVPGLANVWMKTFESDKKIERMFLNGIDAKLAYDLKLKGYIPSGKILEKGDNGDGTVGVCATHQFFHDLTKNILYLYATNNPAKYYSNIELPGVIQNGKAVISMVEITSDFVTIEDLELQGSIYNTLRINNASNVIINNCNIGKYSGRHGIMGSNNSHHVTISNCRIDADWDYDYIFYTQSTPYGIAVYDNTTFWEIKNNFIKDWWMNIYVISHFAKSQYHNIHNNEITSRCSFGKAIQISAGGNWDTPDETFVNFYNNYIHDIVFGMQISASSNKIYFNVFQNLSLKSTNEHGSSGGNAIHIIRDVQYISAKNNSIFNNTFNNLIDYAITYDTRSEVLNNLFVNTGTNRNNVATRVGQYTHSKYINNLFYSEKVNSKSKRVYQENVKEYTLEEFNSTTDEKNNITANNNMEFLGSKNELINEDLTLPINSPAISKGADISHLVSEGFRDRNGNLVNIKSPRIGALGLSDNSNSVKSSSAVSELKVILEGPFKKNKMANVNYKQVPTSQPYNISPWNYSGNEKFTNLLPNMVDWVLIELKNTLTTSSHRFAAILMNDGAIRNYLGENDFSAYKISDGSYYLAIYHRNHISVISSEKVVISNSSIIYDFSNSQLKAQGKEPMRDLGNGLFAMYSGDSDGNGVINNLDFANVANNIFSTEYKPGDLDMNGIINVLDYSKINSNIFKKSSILK
jgi:hypothetical protein